MRCHNESGLAMLLVLFMVAMAHAVTLQWEASPTPTVTGYELDYGVSSRDYTVALLTGTALSASVDGLISGQTYYFGARAIDANGQVSDYSNEVRYTVPGRDTTPPTVWLTSPVDGAAVSHNAMVTMRATASDNVGVTLVLFLVNEVQQCAAQRSPYTCRWKVPSVRGATYMLQAIAQDAQGNQGDSPIIIVMTR